MLGKRGIAIEIYDKIIDQIKATNPIAILLVGSAAKQEHIDIAKLSDVDMFVIYGGNSSFKREIKNIQDIEFDINYLGISTLKKLIDDRVVFILEVMNKNRPLMMSGEVRELIDYGKEIYNKGPKELSDMEIEYLRYDYNIKLADIEKNLDNQFSFYVLSSRLMLDIIRDYFRLNRLWLPKDKKLVKTLEKQDDKLYKLYTSYIQINEPRIKIDYLKEIVNYVVKRFGGLKYNWEKGDFPII